MAGRCYELTVAGSSEVVCHDTVSFRELCRLCDCRQQLMMRLVNLGLLDPAGHGEEDFFTTSSLLRARKALRLRRDLRLNLHSVALVMELLDRIEELEQKLADSSSR